MLGAPTFYWSTIRKYYVAFGALFNDIHVPRADSTGKTTELIRVPLSVGPKDKTLARIIADPDLTRPEAVTLPRMSFELTGMDYDADRHQNAVQSFTWQEGSNTSPRYETLYSPVPFDFQFSLYVYAKYQEDGLAVVEQILPFFTPEFTPRIQVIPEVGLEVNVPIVRGPVTVTDDYGDKPLADRRAIIWTLPFVLKGYLWGPIQQSVIIKFVEANILIPRSDLTFQESFANNTNAQARVTVQPGLLPNGQPTTNAAASVPYTQINLGDDWGYATVIYGGGLANNFPFGNTA